MSDELEMDFDRTSDIPPDKPVPMGFYEGKVAGVKFEGPDDTRPKALYPECTIARISYRLESEDPDLRGKYTSPFPVPVKGHKDSWRWFDWCERMGYNTKVAFRFSAADVEGLPVSLKFDAPREGTGKNAGKFYDNLVDVQKLA